MGQWGVEFGTTKSKIKDMWTVFEQYSFLKPMFSCHTEKSHATTFFGAITTATAMAASMFSYWAKEVLGMTEWVCLMIFIIMFIDLVTGVASAAYMDGRESLCSKKGLRWIFKFGSYTVFIYVLNGLVKESAIHEYSWVTESITAVKLFVIFKICFWELKSIDENLEKMGYSFQIFNMLDPIYNVFKGLIKKNTDVDIDTIDKTKDDNSSPKHSRPRCGDYESEADSGTSDNTVAK